MTDDLEKFMVIEAEGERLVPVSKENGMIDRRHIVHQGRRQ